MYLVFFVFCDVYCYFNVFSYKIMFLRLENRLMILDYYDIRKKLIVFMYS